MDVADPTVTHADMRSFAEDHVNLPREYVCKYRDQVKYLREELERHIADKPEFGLVKMLHAGSVAKGTALRSINDLDVAVYVRNEASVDEKSIVEWTRERLREAYPQKDPGDFTTSPHCVRIHFRKTGLDVDVVPIIDEGKEDGYGYLVDKETGDRLRTNVSRHLAFIRSRKGANPHFATVVRLVKWWAKQRKEDGEFKCKSFLLELLVARMVDSGHDLDDYPRTLETFFSWIASTGLEERVTFGDYYEAGGIASTGDAIEVLDPVNPDNNVTHRYSADDRAALVSAAEEASDAIREARYSTTKARAIERWQAVLGPSFRG